MACRATWFSSCSVPPFTRSALCPGSEVVAGANSGQELLRSIEQRQLLLLPLDQEGQWYRYHRSSPSI